jgi:hypothetical protein
MITIFSLYTILSYFNKTTRLIKIQIFEVGNLYKVLYANIGTKFLILLINNFI